MLHAYKRPCKVALSFSQAFSGSASAPIHSDFGPNPRSPLGCWPQSGNEWNKSPFV